ncbi:hypothetical protein FACS1894216_05200 [Synergistales bacterium]|nr:hypothetical protein FACS1894216_05200 [Synergistales bacterium]
MLTLFNNYKESGKISEALLVGRNLFNRNSANSEVFNAYYNFLCLLAESLPSLNERKDFAGQASVVLAFYSENAELTAERVVEIGNHQQRLSLIIEAISDVECAQFESIRAEIEKRNDDGIKKLYKLKDELHGAATQEQFDKTLTEVGRVDSEIDKDSLTDKQNKIYETLTREHTDLISSKMRELEYKKNIEYNKKASDSFAKAFKQFRDDESKYKNQTQLFSLASSTLFAYDASRLFNETLIYYNHVYSYIFSKMDDEGKLALTRFSIECERKLM